MRETSQQAQEALGGQGSDKLLTMMWQLLASTTAHFVSTDDKLDNIAGRLVQNEVRIAHIEETCGGHEHYMKDRLDQHDKDAGERMQQQDNQIAQMGHQSSS